MVVVVVEMRNHIVVWLQGAHRQGVGFPGEVRVIPPIGIVGITIWDIRLWWFVLTYSIRIF